MKKELDILTIVPNITFQDVVFVWHIASRFKDYKIRMFVAITDDVFDPISTPQLLYKIDTMNKSGHNIHLFLLSYNEVAHHTSKKEVESNYKAAIERFIMEKHDSKFVLYIHPGTIFSQTYPEDIFEMIENNQVFFFAEGYCYYKDLRNYKDENWVGLSDKYPLIRRNLDEKDFYVVATFIGDALKSSYYQSWWGFVEGRFMDGKEMFQ
ncbi:MAG: hypothetical protein N3A54_00920 [Patescibacteria group bacterium]|nr:hypothetical protein [Patescibacteria group bacterium]